MKTTTQKALAALVLGGLSAMSAHAQTVIFSDNFSGTAGNPPNPALWTVSGVSTPGNEVVLTGSNQVYVTDGGGGGTDLEANTGAYTASGIPTASTTDLSPSNYYIQTTISDYTPANGSPYQVDLFAGSPSNFNYLDIAGDQGSTLHFGVASGGSFGSFYDSTVSTSATNQIVIDQYTNDLLVYVNGTLAYDEVVNTPTDALLPLSATAGLYFNTYAGGAGTISPVSVAEVSAEAVPEPNTLALCGLGAFALFLLLNRRRKQSACD